MRRKPPDTPEARAHSEECQQLQGRIERFLSDQGVEAVYDRVRGSQRGDYETPALRVVPTRDGTGRVHMSLVQLAGLLGVTREQLMDPNMPLSSLVFDDEPTDD